MVTQPVRTCRVVRKNYREWRQQTRQCVLDTLARVDKPQTTGDLFLLTQVSHTVLNVLLREMRDEGLVCGEVAKTCGKTVVGVEYRHKAMHWTLTTKGGEQARTMDFQRFPDDDAARR